MTKKGLGERAAVDRLRDLILSGAIGPGQRLVEAEIAERLNVSRAAARAAFVQLASEQLVERIPNQGARIRVVTPAEAIAVNECRMALECLCARKAAQRATDEDAATLQRIGDEMQRAVQAGEPMVYSSLNEELHSEIRRIAAQPVADDLLRIMHARLAHHRFRLALRPGRPAQSLPQHLDMIAAISARDADAAEEATRRHLQDVIRILEEAAEAGELDNLWR